MSESLNRQLADLHAERVATWAPAALQVNINQRQRLVDEAPGKDFVKVGDVLEPFTLLKVEGGELNRELLLADGPAVLIFFRFAGCPACNIALPYYQRQLYPRLRELGVPLIAVSPQVPERLVEIKTRHNLELQVASDPDNTLGRSLGVLYSFDEASRKAALTKGKGIGETTGTGTWELPQPTVVVIAKDGRVVFTQVSPDWLVRTEAEPVLRVVEQLLGQAPLPIAI
ncbi:MULTISPECIES: peroxiredoxin-like family protein [unclassified Pseudomonas]|uniref:peroxiredoxin-like family protein n=1 Tax=unclassified Pseudomonas TaxID=196821 RepID=UPI0011ED6474|nr:MULTISPECIES: peroxiredoxin-like family protein [unclassified Pseudomonas]KAA0944837.1 AhpC/TSA family protein [Pseudomonas sp. ANT_H4]KAA0952667.1 AhpC/TSA family protein [Pseudomonas sp. ANT_H14]